MASTNTSAFLKTTGLLVMAIFLLTSLPANARERLSWDYSVYDKLNTLFTTGEGPLYGEKQGRRTYHLRFVVEGESLQDWTEILEIINTDLRDEPDEVGAWFERFRVQGNKTCPSDWVVIEEQSDSIIFQRTAKNCQGFDDQDAVYRVLYGKKNVFVIFATLKGEMDEASRMGYLNVLRSAEVRN